MPDADVELQNTRVLVAEGSEAVISGVRWSADCSPPPVPGSTLAEIERYVIMTTYEACGRSPRRTAQVLGLSTRTIH